MTERANLTMRLTMSQFTRTTTERSRKTENHAPAIGAECIASNSVLPHSTLTRGGMIGRPIA